MYNAGYYAGNYLKNLDVAAALGYLWLAYSAFDSNYF